ncbi:MAG: acetyl-CoA carboxylase biotin carboxylase subunit, partial [Planctomycetota bacterium]
FQPCPGRINDLFIPGGPGVRFDSHVKAGYTVPPFYDSMIGKLIVHRPTRQEAIACMLRALHEFEVDGIATTVPFHMRVLQEPAFASGQVDTKWVERELL